MITVNLTNAYLPLLLAAQLLPLCELGVVFPEHLFFPLHALLPGFVVLLSVTSVSVSGCVVGGVSTGVSVGVVVDFFEGVFPLFGFDGFAQLFAPHPPAARRKEPFSSLLSWSLSALPACVAKSAPLAIPVMINFLKSHFFIRGLLVNIVSDA